MLCAVGCPQRTRSPDVHLSAAALTTSRISLGRAHLLAASLIREATRAGIPATSLNRVGSLRRFAPDIGDVALLAGISTAHHPDVLARFSTLPMVTAVLARTPSTAVVGTTKGRATLHVVAPDHV